MVTGKLWFWLLNTLRVKWAVYRKTALWLLFWLVVGVVWGIITIAMGDIGADDINTKLIDRNLLNMAGVAPGVGTFLWQRVQSIVVPVLLLFGCALLGRAGSLAVWPFMVLHGYWLCLSFWWTWRYYHVNAVFLLAFYGFWLIMVTAVLGAGILWALNLAAQLRDSRWHGAGGWGRFWSGVAWLTVVSVVMGAIEYLVFAWFLGRIVYKPL